MRSNKVENNILAAARTEISRRGLRFTMDSLASHLRISKKTLYEIVGCKRELISQVIDAALISIAENEIRIYQDFNLSLMDKFAKLVELYRMNLKPFDTATIRDMMQLYPELWEKIETLRLSKWQSLIRTIQFQISKDTCSAPQSQDTEIRFVS